MLRVLEEAVVKTSSQIMTEHPGLAFIMLNPEQPLVGGIIELPRGTLYAVADRDGVEELAGLAGELQDTGVDVLIDTTPLVANQLFLGL